MGESREEWNNGMCGYPASQPVGFFWDQRLAEASPSSWAKFRAELRGSSPGPFHYSSAEKGPSSVSPQQWAAALCLFVSAVTKHKRQQRRKRRAFYSPGRCLASWNQWCICLFVVLQICWWTELRGIMCPIVFVTFIRWLFRVWAIGDPSLCVPLKIEDMISGVRRLLLFRELRFRSCDRAKPQSWTIGCQVINTHFKPDVCVKGKNVTSKFKGRVHSKIKNR